MSTKEKLAWGARDLVPEDAKAAWGARLIVDATGYVDLVPDRQDLVYADGQSRQDLISHLVGSEWHALLSTKLKTGEVKTHEAEEVTVYEDDAIKVAGNSNGSAGYFYIAGWLK